MAYCITVCNPDSLHEQQYHSCGQCVSGCQISMAGVEWRECKVGL